MPTITTDQLVAVITAVCSFVLSLALEHVPGLKGTWEKFAYKAQVWVGGGIVVALVLLGADAIGAVNLVLPEPFWWAGFWAWATPVFAWISVGQISYTGQKAFGLLERTNGDVH